MWSLWFLHLNNALPETCVNCKLLCDAPCIVEIQYEPLPNSVFVSFHIRMHALPGAQYEPLLNTFVWWCSPWNFIYWESVQICAYHIVSYILIAPWSSVVRARAAQHDDAHKIWRPATIIRPAIIFIQLDQYEFLWLSDIKTQDQDQPFGSLSNESHTNSYLRGILSLSICPASKCSSHAHRIVTISIIDQKPWCTKQLHIIVVAAFGSHEEPGNPRKLLM